MAHSRCQRPACTTASQASKAILNGLVASLAAFDTLVVPATMISDGMPYCVVAAGMTRQQWGNEPDASRIWYAWDRCRIPGCHHVAL
jgi:hypothetical protein